MQNGQLQTQLGPLVLPSNLKEDNLKEKQAPLQNQRENQLKAPQHLPQSDIGSTLPISQESMILKTDLKTESNLQRNSSQHTAQSEAKRPQNIRQKLAEVAQQKKQEESCQFSQINKLLSANYIAVSKYKQLESEMFNLKADYSQYKLETVKQTDKLKSSLEEEKVNLARLKIQKQEDQSTITLLRQYNQKLKANIQKKNQEHKKAELREKNSLIRNQFQIKGSQEQKVFFIIRGSQKERDQSISVEIQTQSNNTSLIKKIDNQIILQKQKFQTEIQKLKKEKETWKNLANQYFEIVKTNHQNLNQCTTKSHPLQHNQSKKFAELVQKVNDQSNNQEFSEHFSNP